MSYKIQNSKPQGMFHVCTHLGIPHEKCVFTSGAVQFFHPAGEYNHCKIERVENDNFKITYMFLSSGECKKKTSIAGVSMDKLTRIFKR